MHLASDRHFKLWSYSVSHKQLLIRSPKTSDDDSNVDIVMWGVEHLDLATSLDGIRLDSPSNEEIRRAEQFLGKDLDSSQVFCFISGEKRFIVVARGFKVLKNELDIFESSLEHFAGTDPTRQLGIVLAHS